jgi:hypothetical protein
MYFDQCDAGAFSLHIRIKTEISNLSEDLIKELLLLIFHRFELKHKVNQKKNSGSC